MTDRIRPLKIDEATKERLRILFIAKHALWGGGLHPEDGNHAVYHVEVRTILQAERLKRSRNPWLKDVVQKLLDED